MRRSLGIWVLALLLLFPMAVWAQVSIEVIAPSGQKVPVTAKNASRTDHTIILFDRDFGTSTRTNPYGVEVVAKPTEKGQYQVTGITSVWECQKQNNLNACGNAMIPEGGLVLSAAGEKRQALLESFQIGDTFSLSQDWFQRKTVKVDVINPTPQNNPLASGFPGYRGGNQLIVYDKHFGKPTTGTNEFGFEVTVINGIVVAQEGSDSTIPEDGFVLSGHGRARNWLVANAPIGARIMLHEGGEELTSLINFDTYRYQYQQKLANSPCSNPQKTPEVRKTCEAILSESERADRLNLQGEYDEAVTTLAQSVEKLNRLIWTQATPFPASAIKAAWHRPVELTAAEIGQTLDMLKKGGLNTVFLETFFHGYTIFPSETFKAYGLPAQNPKFASADLLKLWVEEAHKRDMKVHVWFQTFYSGTNAYLPPGPILEKYPHWANFQYSALDLSKLDQPQALKPSTLELGAYFLDPANPETREFVARLAEEIVTRYDVDGFQLDYIRYPSSFPTDRYSYHKTTWGYTPVARAAFMARHGVDPVELNPKEDQELWETWNRFKVEQINSFVEQVTRMIRTKRPHVKISAAIFPERESALIQKHQDWTHWAQQGWVDFLAPMTLTSATKVVQENTGYVYQVTHGKVPVVSGVFGPFNNNTAEQVLEQLEAARLGGASGFSLFDTAHMTGRMIEALQASQGKVQAHASKKP